jgi:hypothetical protein
MFLMPGMIIALYTTGQLENTLRWGGGRLGAGRVVRRAGGWHVNFGLVGNAVQGYPSAGTHCYYR